MNKNINSVKTAILNLSNKLCNRQVKRPLADKCNTN